LILSDVKAYAEEEKYIAKIKDTIDKMSTFFATFGQLFFFINHSLRFVQYLQAF